MDLMEYKAHEVFERYGIPQKRSVLIDSLDGLAEKAGALEYPLMVKAQVQTGGRGKAGGIRPAANADELRQAASDILGMSIKGHQVDTLLLVEQATVQAEMYISLMLDRASKTPTLIFSPMGGIDIEDVAATHPDKIARVPIDPLIGVRDYTVRYAMNATGVEASLFEQLFTIAQDLFTVFRERDCTLVEINPLAVCDDGTILALDGKVTVDDSALYRQPDILAFRDALSEHPLIKEARTFRFLYIPCEPDGDVAVMSNGSGLLMSCMDLIAQDRMVVGAALDLGGGATSDRIAEGIRIMLSAPNITSLFITIFGGITRCDEVAAGVQAAVEHGHAADKLVIVKIEGTNREQGREILERLSGNIVPVATVREGVKELAARRVQT